MTSQQRKQLRLAETNLALTKPSTDPNWESKKAKLRARLKAEHSAPPQTVVSPKEIAIRDAAYWTHPPELRLKYMKEALEAQKKWAEAEKKQSKRGRPRKADPAAVGPNRAKVLKRKRLAIPTERPCRVCGIPFKSIRPDATLCSARCRKQASRSTETAHATL